MVVNSEGHNGEDVVASSQGQSLERLPAGRQRLEASSLFFAEEQGKSVGDIYIDFFFPETLIQFHSSVNLPSVTAILS